VTRGTPVGVCRPTGTAPAGTTVAGTSMAGTAASVGGAGCPGSPGVPGGVVYLLHFDRPYRHARHYTGWTTNLPGRLAEHTRGRGARLLAVIDQAGIGWRLSRTWSGTRGRERALKRQGGAGRRCPDCGITPRSGHRSGGQ
jgi:predicted GIY-YIG superfamily endonuclease